MCMHPKLQSKKKGETNQDTPTRKQKMKKSSKTIGPNPMTPKVTTTKEGGNVTTKNTLSPLMPALKVMTKNERPNESRHPTEETE